MTDRRKHVRLFSAMGFEHMTPEERRAASSKGGKTSGQSKKHNRFNTHTAKIAGRKGGAAHSPEHMAKLGRLGGSVPRVPKADRCTCSPKGMGDSVFVHAAHCKASTKE